MNISIVPSGEGSGIALDQEAVQFVLRVLRVRFHLFGLPQPAHHIGKNRRTVLPVVPSVCESVVHLVARPLQGAQQLLVGHPPVAAVDVQIVFAVL